ncbi:gp53-like domain-containing protein [Burkholderia ubonensis]|uniref:Putative tail fiber protein gp53-like C-terminal domain-containing protein n=1 Tax=Burkholderia ubonensis TaxID=101571 RepID=A0AA40R9Q6_9BURK|nr:hypothetical protein [Burkholderia ubonensis]KVO79038.1 hypothetical protein WJ79_00975 [Burkholderia ubonensis]KVP00977.1 hypothetical protein WJ83_15475 [Burkholderia ubonensis]KVP38136.1 hypothetical protein WJ89_23200 [Burkholderia ubonensis]KVP62516.1 hypothetical protein WJ91_02835 [Burkholderia ubonensis]KVQ86085.1 hypothetical protein WK06_05790 [Burkholderia ubonensis]
MTDLVESSTWTPGIRQFETSDPVEGGPDGIDNVPLRQLANRTRFLKDRQEAHEAAVDPYPQYATKADLAQKVAALVDQSPEALNTLRELANALGNDPGFATTMTNALAQKAPIESPVFTGVAKGTTPGQFDSSTRLATTAFVQRALGNFQAVASVSSAVTLTAADAGRAFTLNTGASVTLPLFSSVQPGASFVFVNAGPTMTISRQGSDLLFGPSAAQNGSLTGNATGVTLQTGDWCTITAMIGWEVTAGSPLLTLNNGAFGAVLAGSGYQKLPSGLIIQWGYTSVPANSLLTVPLPIAFPNASFGVACAADDPAANGTQYRWTAGARTRSTINIVNNWPSGPISGSWITWGI